MSEPLSEAAGCDLLAGLFRSRGYAIKRNVAFRHAGITFDIDGWDAKARVGFEFLSSEKDDHDDLSLEEFERLKDAEQRGELFIFVVDEVEPLSADGLRQAAESFLDDVDAARRPRRGSAAVKTKVAKPVRKKAPTRVKGTKAKAKTAVVKKAKTTKTGATKVKVVRASAKKAAAKPTTGRSAAGAPRKGRRRSGR